VQEALSGYEPTRLRLDITKFEAHYRAYAADEQRTALLYNSIVAGALVSIIIYA
jgi:hypothetical protein